MIRTLALASLLSVSPLASSATTLLTEGFENVAGLGSSGWHQTNLSSPAGLPWLQGFVGPFAAQGGSPESYAAVNFESAVFGSGGVVDNWLMTPTLSFQASNTVSFWTRTVFNPSIFPDRLELRLSLEGSSVATSDFSATLLSVNPDLTQTGYPNVWSQYTASFAALPGASGRLAFRYTVPSNFEADFIGLDTVSVTAVPEPATWLMLGLGVAAMGLVGQRRRPRLARAATAG